MGENEEGKLENEFIENLPRNENNATSDSYICAIDFGTQSVRIIIYNWKEEVYVSEQTAFSSIFPEPGWVQQDPIEMINKMNETIEKSVDVFCCKLNIEKSEVSKYIKAVGVTNQRETTILWDSITGKPLFDALVWNDVRTAQIVKKFAGKDGANEIKKKTGLPISTYFSAVKIKWLEENVAEIKDILATPDRCYFGTVDTWLIWNLGKRFVTDVTNASRTMLMNLETLQWDPSLISFFEISQNLKLPTICSSSEIYTYIVDGPLKGVPIAGCLGDQQAALVGQKCLAPGQAKNTCGTGCFVLFNAGLSLVKSDHALSTVAFQLGPDKPVYYALEGAIATAGLAVSWLKDSINLVDNVEDVSNEAMKVKDNGGMYFVPAFSGLFAPHWKDDARGIMVGLTNFTTKSHICRAVLESVAFQTKDVLDAMKKDSSVELVKLNVDGGMTNSKVFLQIQADILGIPVFCPKNSESTSLGAAFVAGLAVGVYSIDSFVSSPSSLQMYSPSLLEEERSKIHEKWKKAVEKSFGWADM